MVTSWYLPTAFKDCVYLVLTEACSILILLSYGPNACRPLECQNLIKYTHTHTHMHRHTHTHARSTYGAYIKTLSIFPSIALSFLNTQIPTCLTHLNTQSSYVGVSVTTHIPCGFEYCSNNFTSNVLQSVLFSNYCKIHPF